MSFLSIIVKMATGSGWQQQYYCPTGQGKFNSSTASSFQSGIAMEYTQDLHLKMSKKIAQLTKVWGVFMRSLCALCSSVPAVNTNICNGFLYTKFR